MSKIIFLDIDGVLNSSFWNDEHQKEISDGTLIDKEKIMLLAKLVSRTNAKIILHDTLVEELQRLSLIHIS